MIMKKYLIITSCLVASFFLSCDSLDLENLGSYDADKVWNDEKLAKADIAHIYSSVFPVWNTGADAIGGQQSGIYFDDSYISITSDIFKKWSYTNVRLVNEAITYMEAGNIPENVKRPLIGECLFMRAYLYFDMLVYHGGVPYIKIPQDKDKDDLYVTRNSSKECFDFIIQDLDAALASSLPDRISPSSANYGRIDKAFVLSFKAKVLLQKASPQFNPKNPYTNTYWKEAYDAAKIAYDHCIANGIKLMDNYADIWNDGGCAEEIFTRIYDYPNTTTIYYEWYSRPSSLSSGSVAGNGPTWAMVRSFPMLDGKPYDDITGKYYGGTEDDFMQKYWENRDPRFYVSVLYPGIEYPVSGTATGYRQYSALGIAHINDNYGQNPKAGVVSANNNLLSSFYTLKGTDPSLSKAEVGAFSNDLPIMRFAEVMMIYAEAANETGHSDIAQDMLKQIRKRAGIEIGDGSYALPGANNREGLRDAILFERSIEFCFEGHRFWDLRRTRNLHILSGLTKYGLETIAIEASESGKPEMDMDKAKELAKDYKLTPYDFKYIKQQIPLSAGQVKEYGQMKDSYYFFPIQQNHLDTNNKLIQNADWGGTFVPTLD